MEVVAVEEEEAVVGEEVQRFNSHRPMNRLEVAAGDWFRRPREKRTEEIMGIIQDEAEEDEVVEVDLVQPQVNVVHGSVESVDKRDTREIIVRIIEILI